MFRCGIVPVISKPTRVTRYTASTIDHMFINFILNTKIKSAIQKADIFDHLPILFVAKVKVYVSIKTEQYMLKCNISGQSIKKFKFKFKSFLKFVSSNFSFTVEGTFSKDINQIKTTKKFLSVDNNSIRKSSKRKQRLYEKFLKTTTAKSEAEYKTYKNMFETLQRKSKRNCYPKKYFNIKIALKKHGIL